MTQDSWGKKGLRGSVYDLSHLDAFVLDVMPGDPNARILKAKVSFGMHTFTVKRLPEHTPDLFMGAAAKPRSFCPIRHACSLHLPGQIRQAGRRGGNAYKSHGGNFLIVDRIPVVKNDYAAVFKLEASDTPEIDVQMFVISAYAPDVPTQNLKEISFYTLIRKFADGDSV